MINVSTNRKWQESGTEDPKKRKYAKPSLIILGHIAAQTLNAGCDNADDVMGPGTAFPNPQPSGIARVCI